MCLKSRISTIFLDQEARQLREYQSQESPLQLDGRVQKQGATGGKARGKVAFPGHSLLTLAPLLLARASLLLSPAPVPLAALNVQPVLSQAVMNVHSQFS